MALHPRVALDYPAVAAVSTIAFFGMSIFLFGHLGDPRQTLEDATERAEKPCAHLTQWAGPEIGWSESTWVGLSYCFQQEQNNSREAVRVAARGLKAYPQSESLWNVKAYNLLRLEEYRAAQEVLTIALKRIEPTNVTMENNLAWAGLWTGDRPNGELRILYASALDKDPRQCDTLHTGILVEYTIALDARDVYEEATARKRMQMLVERYADCHSASATMTWDTLVEYTGVAVAFEHLDMDHGQEFLSLEALRTTQESLFRNSSTEALCHEAIPASIDVPCAQIVDPPAKTGALPTTRTEIDRQNSEVIRGFLDNETFVDEPRESASSAMYRAILKAQPVEVKQRHQRSTTPTLQIWR